MHVNVNIDPRAATRHESAVVNVLAPDGTRVGQLDIGCSELLSIRNPKPTATDFLLLAATIYALDKLVARDTAEDCWTRNFHVSLPVSDPKRWSSVTNDLCQCLSFLTGDMWTLSFVQAQSLLMRPRARVRTARRAIVRAEVDTVSLFSGGLDSLVGAIDKLESTAEKLLLVGHHDGQVAGPYSDQCTLIPKLASAYRNRVSRLLVRVGHEESGRDTTFRSRSIVFIALGLYAASSFSDEMSLLVPENGTIALNVPLTPSRRGSCSTRTAHPYYLKMLRQVLAGLGITNPIINPLQPKTKGEAVQQCLNQQLLRALASDSVSCAKRGHTFSWQDRTAKGCGRCMPCIYRRAALHTIGLDTQKYGSDICTGGVDVERHEQEAANDLRACFSFLKRNLSPAKTSRMLLASGSLEVSQLPAYADLVRRAMDEIRKLLRDKGNSEVQRQAGLLISVPHDA